MTRKRLQHLRAIYSEIARMADSADAHREFAQAFEAELAAERDHRRMGARFTNGQASYRHSCADAARLFVCKWVIEGMKRPADWAETCTVRDGARLGYAVHDKIRSSRRRPVHYPAFDYDYVTDIVGGQ